MFPRNTQAARCTVSYHVRRLNNMASRVPIDSDIEVEEDIAEGFIGRVLLGRVLLGRVLLGRVLLGRVLLGRVLLG